MPFSKSNELLTVWNSLNAEIVANEMNGK
jgi:hypothetical protein